MNKETLDKNYEAIRSKVIKERGLAEEKVQAKMEALLKGIATEDFGENLKAKFRIDISRHWDYSSEGPGIEFRIEPMLVDSDDKRIWSSDFDLYFTTDKGIKISFSSGSIDCKEDAAAWRVMAIAKILQNKADLQNDFNQICKTYLEDFTGDLKQIDDIANEVAKIKRAEEQEVERIEDEKVEKLIAVGQKFETERYGKIYTLEIIKLTPKYVFWDVSYTHQNDDDERTYNYEDKNKIADLKKKLRGRANDMENVGKVLTALA